MQNRVEPPILLSRIMMFVLATALVVLATLGITVYKMFPLNRPQIFFLTTVVRDNLDVRLVQMQPKSENLDRYTKAFVREYIRHRNEIFSNPNAMHQKWNSNDGAVRIMSTDQVYAIMSPRYRTSSHVFNQKTSEIECKGSAFFLVEQISKQTPPPSGALSLR